MTDEATVKYRLVQFNKVKTQYYEFKPKLKIIKPDGETNWIDIEEAELQQIISILTLLD